ncbi:MAG TPA: sigma-70 family RNA polymerase sigma factor [Gaiellaceae bacterium]|nr:sigma-70 family RNA polymerase sigma factor [Gaiellaceae bacterium]
MDRLRDPADDRVVSYLPLVRALARRHTRPGAGFDDLVQAGAVGLVAASRRYDAARGAFGPYAAATIEGEMRRYLRDRASTVRVPRREQARARALREAPQGTPLPAAAAAAGLSLDEARRALAGASATVPLGALDDRECPEASEAIEACERRALVEELLAALSPRERAAVVLRFGSDLPQREIGRRLHLSQSQTSRVLSGALEKLRRTYEAA